MINKIVEKIIEPIEYQDAFALFGTFSDEVVGLLYESVDIAPIHGRRSLIAIDPIVEVLGTPDGAYTVSALQPAGEKLLEGVQVPDKNVIPSLLQQLQHEDPYLGLYGMFSYDYVRQFEHLPQVHPVGTVPDVQLFIPDMIYVFDHFKQTAEVHYYKITDETLAERLARIPRAASVVSQQFEVGEMQANQTEAEYIERVEKAKNYMRMGDIFEIVLSRKFTASFNGSSLGLYQQYREANPSPYMFYIRTPERTLLGASPEMLVRVEAGTVMTRPISGTAVRKANAIEDYQQMLNLLNNQKEKSELDMLIDLARNDLARVCLPGISVTDYRYVEKYSKVMHTVAQVTGQLDTERHTAFDALVACLNAGTLTGAPKIRAMELIEELEPERRGFYGGCIGYLTFNNELNTGITIRSAVISAKGGSTSGGEGKIITTQSGASIVLDSDPVLEFQETQHKSRALRETLQPTIV